MPHEGKRLPNQGSDNFHLTITPTGLLLSFGLLREFLSENDIRLERTYHVECTPMQLRSVALTEQEGELRERQDFKGIIWFSGGKRSVVANRL